MEKAVLIKVKSILLNILLAQIGYVFYTLVFNSIIISHYGGLSTIFSFYSLLIALILATGIAFFSRSFLSLANRKSFVQKFMILVLLAGITSFTYITMIWCLTRGIYGRSILDPLNDFMFYNFLGASLIQLIFLQKFLSTKSSLTPIKTIIFQLILFLTFITGAFFMMNAEDILESHERRKSEPNYMKGNMRKLRLVIDEKCSNTAPIVDGKIIIDFSENGLAIIPNDEDSGFHISDCTFYYTDESQVRQELFIVDIHGDGNETADDYEQKHNVKGIIYGGPGHILGLEPDGTYSTAAPTAILCWDFYIRSTNYTYEANPEKKMELLTEKLVNECRLETND